MIFTDATCVVQMCTAFAYTRTNDALCCCMQQVTHTVSGEEREAEFCNLMTVDESGCSITTRDQSTEFTMENVDITSLKKAEVVRSAGKVMMIIFFDKEDFPYQHTVY